jgi:SMI1 / KNR4 family (SUKH-1)
MASRRWCVTRKQWADLLGSLEVNYRMGRPPLTPAAQGDIEAFERARGVPLPRSYREYCAVFGAGEVALRFKIAVPGFKGDATAFSLEDLDKVAHEGLDYEEYSRDPRQHERGIFFCTDTVRSYHFFDPADADPAGEEYAVYTLFSDFEVERTADNFWEFVTGCCLGDRWEQLVKGGPPERVFMPVTI